MKNAMSRFQVVDVAQAGPGECLVTRTPTGPFIDTGVILGAGERMPFRGRVYLSVDAVREMADQAGLFDPYADEAREIAEAHLQAVRQAKVDGYAEGYAAKVDASADELVDRMRARVQRDRDASAHREPAAADAPAEHAAEPGAEAAGVEGRDDVLDADGDRAAAA